MDRFNRSVLLTGGALTLTFVYLCAAYIPYRNDTIAQKIQQDPNAYKLVEPAMEHSTLHDAYFFRETAEKLAALNRPKWVMTLLRLAMIKGPADFNNFLTAAVYAGSSTCCIQQTPDLFREAVRRRPRNAEIHIIAGNSLLRVGLKEKALPYFRQALIVNDSTSHRVYQLVLKHGGSIQDLIGLTPRKPESLVALFSYLSTRRNVSYDEMKALMHELDGIEMQPEERIKVAAGALRLNDPEWARMQAVQALESPATRVEALRILLRLAEKEADWKKYETLASEIEQAHVANGAKEEGASVALEAAQKLSASESVEEKAQRFQQISKRYPDHAHTHIVMAQLYENDRPDLAIVYLQQAIRISPERFDYSSRLAKQYLEMFRFVDAEEIYKKFLHIPRFQVGAYLGLAMCKQKSDKPEEAVMVLRAALKQHEKSISLLQELARTYESMEAYRKAAEVYEEIAVIAPRKPASHLLIGQMYEKAGDFIAAKKQYQFVLQIDPRNKQARNALARVSK